MQSISTNVVQDWTVRYLYIAWIFIMLAIALLAFSSMCFLKFRCLSRKPPRYLTVSLTAIGSLWVSRGSGDVFLAAARSQRVCIPFCQGLASGALYPSSVLVVWMLPLDLFWFCVLVLHCLLCCCVWNGHQQMQ